MQKPTTRKRPSGILLGMSSAIRNGMRNLIKPEVMPTLSMFGHSRYPQPKKINQKKIRKHRRQCWRIWRRI